MAHLFHVGLSTPSEITMTDKPKTWKREVAFLMICFLGVIVWNASEASPLETLKVVIWPVMLFAGAAFGMEWAAKQTDMVGPK